MPIRSGPSWSELRRRHVVYEDDDLLGFDKPPGLSVTGERHDTDLVELAGEAGEPLWPVHRIDKVTSGLVLLARRLEAHGPLTRQFNQRTVDKTYLAVTRSTGLPASGTIDLPLGVGRKNRVRIAAPGDVIRFDEDARRWWVPDDVVSGDRTYPSMTAFVRVATSDTHTVLVVRPVTGRRHQIRVHLAWIGHPIDGDPLFETAPTSPRAHLHSWQLALDVERSGARRRLELTADPDASFWSPVGDRGGGRLLARAAPRVAELPPAAGQE